MCRLPRRAYRPDGYFNDLTGRVATPDHPRADMGIG